MNLSEETVKALVAMASAARNNAYAPYSSYAVGAALLGASGRTYTGANVENAAYPTSMCAERTAVFKAVSEGERQFQALAVVTANGGSPCGSCRQVLSEFGIDLPVLIADETENIVLQTTVRELLPYSFGSLDLDKPA